MNEPLDHQLVIPTRHIRAQSKEGIRQASRLAHQQTAPLLSSLGINHCVHSLQHLKWWLEM